jgi:hypothetical protein
VLVQSVLTVLATLAIAFPIQTGRGVREPRGGTTSCSASGATCLFGSAAECNVTCVIPRHAFCHGACCHFGFPTAAVCECRGD